MTTSNQQDRRQRIEAAAFELLEEKGYRSTSMLQIAKRAGASNQTLYAWYGNKQGLFQGIIESNGERVSALLQQSLQHTGDPLETLRLLGPLLLGFASSDKAITLNRAAIIDAADTGLLGEAIDKAARDGMMVQLTELMTALTRAGTFAKTTDPAEAAQSYISLLFGEVQFRQALGRMPALSDNEVDQRAARAFDLTCRLYLA